MPTSLHWVVLFASHSILHTSKGQVWKKGCRLWRCCSQTVSTASLFYLFTHYATGSCFLLSHLMDWAWLAFRFVCELHIVLHWHNCRKETSELPGTGLKQLQNFFSSGFLLNDILPFTCPLCVKWHRRPPVIDQIQDLDVLK